jgi:Right handed beta helix region
MSIDYYSEPGVFNACDPWYDTGSGFVGLIPNSMPDAAQNTLVLQVIIDIAQAFIDQSQSYGATILIPGHDIVPGPVGPGGPDHGSHYYFSIPDTGQPVITIQDNWPIRFLGTGSTHLTMIPDADGNFGHFFSLQTSGTVIVGDEPIKLGDHRGGMTFEDLYFTYPDTADGSGYAAIYVTPAGTLNLRVLRCVFLDCPIGVDIQQGLFSTITQCLFEYKHNSGVAISIGNTEPGMSGGFGKQVNILGNVFYSDHSNIHAVQTALQVYGVDHLKVADCRIDSYNNGIMIQPGPGRNAVHCTFANVAVFVGTDSDDNLGSPLTIQPNPHNDAGDTISVSQVSFTSCSFEMGQGATPASGVPGINIDASYGLVDNVRFVSCFSTQWPGPGLAINGAPGNATNIEVVGGFYSGNQYADEGNPSCGIYVATAAGVRIIGSGCIGSYQVVTDGGNNNSLVQSYGIYLDSGAEDVVIDGCDIRLNGIAGIKINGDVEEIIIDGCNLTDNVTNGIVIDAASTSVTNVFIRNCDVTGYSLYSVAIDVLTSGSNAHTVQVTDCAGYNDQGVGGTFSVSFNVSFHAYDRFYYGPATLYVPLNATTSNIKVGATNTGLTSGSFVLAPSVAAEIIGTPGSITFSMVGQ